MNNQRVPVTTIEDLDTLMGEEIVEGYMDGLEDLPCGDNRSRSYWHGWRNGRMDGGHVTADAAQQLLAFEVQRARWLKVLN